MKRAAYDDRYNSQTCWFANLWDIKRAAYGDRYNTKRVGLQTYLI